MSRSDNPLIGVGELLAALGDPGLVVVDCRHQLMDVDAGLRSYREGHIPGARHIHLDRDLSRRPEPGDGRHPLPAASDFGATLGRFGVSDRSRVVAYDDANGAMAARLWWMLRWLGHEHAYVLDGGFAAWRAAGSPVEQDTPSWAPASYSAGAAHDEWIVSADELQHLLDIGDTVLLDARDPKRFDGQVEPIDAVAGHVPGARNLPFEQLVDSQGRFLEPDVLKERLAGISGGRPAERIVAMCGSGVTACHLLLAIERAGFGIGRLYAGSWSEWITDPARPIATNGLR